MYYNHKLIKEFEQFVFPDIKSLLKKFPSLSKVWRDINQFRIANGHDKLLPTKHKLIEYNEVIFQKSVEIKPVAIFGYQKNAREIAKKYRLPYYASAKKFFDSDKK